MRSAPGYTRPLARYAVVVYLSALAAQLFAHAFDATGSLLPPPAVSVASWYLNPLAGPKTLYGVVVLLPLTVWIAGLGAHTPIRRSLDLYTPALLSVLSIARLGCLLQGCCFGLHSSDFGVPFPPGSAAQAQHVVAGLVALGEPSLPVIPTQGLEAVALALLAAWAVRKERRSPNASLFTPAIVVYSIFRFLIEFVRADVDRGLYGPLATSQWIALAILVVVALGGGSGRAFGHRSPEVAAG
jgi:phosphatidylglycerol:prolipoprotein diacylglycerol transferase